MAAGKQESASEQFTHRLSSTGGGSSTSTTSCSTTGGGTCPSSFTCHDGSQPGGGSCGCYTVSGLGDRKAAILDSGARQGLDSALVRYMLASAMMETETFSTDYAYGDNKTQGSSCWGLCKQNWDMIRTCHPAWTTRATGTREPSSTPTSTSTSWSTSNAGSTTATSGGRAIVTAGPG